MKKKENSFNSNKSKNEFNRKIKYVKNEMFNKILQETLIEHNDVLKRLACK